MNTPSIKKILQILAVGSALIGLCSCNSEAESESKATESARNAKGGPKLSLHSLRGAFNKVVGGVQRKSNTEPHRELSREEMIQQIGESEIFEDIDPQRLSELESRFQEMINRGAERLQEFEREAMRAAGEAQGYGMWATRTTTIDRSFASSILSLNRKKRNGRPRRRAPVRCCGVVGKDFLVGRYRRRRNCQTCLTSTHCLELPDSRTASQMY